MATTTPNYGWPVPTSTDYVKDGATAIEALGDAIDATVFGLPSSALTLISSTTVGSAVASVTVSSAFSATYDNYRILISGITFSSTGQSLTMVFNNSSGSFYYYGGQDQEYAGGITARSGSGVSSLVVALTGASSTTNCNIDVFNPFLTQATGFIAQSASSTYSARHAGYNSTASSQTGFTFTPAAGTMTGGKIKVYGYKN